MLWYRHCTLGRPSGVSSPPGGTAGSWIVHRPQPIIAIAVVCVVRTLRCILLRVKRCYLLTVDREPSRAALSAQFFSVRHAASATASIAMTFRFRPRHDVTSEIAPCRCTAPPAARPAAAHPRAVVLGPLPPLGWCRSVDERSQNATRRSSAVRTRRVAHGSPECGDCRYVYCVPPHN